MACIKAIAALRYNSDRFGADISDQIAPPYDVLDRQRKDELLSRSDHNIVAVDLPYVPASKAGPGEVYERAGRLLQEWLSDGTLVRDPQPMLYRYHQTFSDDNQQHTRKKFFAALRVSQFDQGEVLPHEETFGGPKEDRLRLMQSTACNLSPVFALYTDPAAEVARALEQDDSPPDVTARLDDAGNSLWCVTDAGTIDAVQSLMKDKVIYIADGHHRYGTALMYRNWLVQRQGPIADDHPANFVLVALCAMEDHGLRIRPTHRVVKNLAGFDVDRLIANSNGAVRLVEPAHGNWQSLLSNLESLPTGSVGLVHPSSGRGVLLVMEREDVLDQLEPQRSQEWRRFGLSILHRFIVDRLIADQSEGPPSIRYTSRAREAVELATRSNGLALLVQPTRMDQLREICRAGDLMPQKSTYFYPKLATGMVINPLY